MFEKFVLNKIDNENVILKNLVESKSPGENLTKINILNSDLSDFTKNYLVFEFNDKADAEELTSKISKANKLYFNYTIRPKWTLQTFLFNNFESRPPGEIIKKLNLFTFYSFYVNAVKDFINDNTQIFITRNEVSSIIDHTNEAIHNKLLNDISNAKIKNFFLQIFLLKYDNESNFNLESTVPYSFIKIFLEDKSFLELDKKFTAVKGISAEKEISLKDIIKVLNDKYSAQEKDPSVNKSSDEKKIDIIPEEKKDPEVKNSDKKKDKVSEEEIEITDVKKIEVKKDILINETIEISDVTNNDILSEKSDKGSIAEKLYSDQLINADKEIKEVENNETDIENPDDALKNLFSEKQLEKILNKVYGSDLIYREKSFDKLRDYRTWSEASAHLKDIFMINNVDLYNKDVVAFVNILNDYYQNKE